jgi:cytochrome c-type biogenesis protein CcmH/NrfG
MKLNKKNKMNKIGFLGLSLLFSATTIYAQDINEAKKAIDAEKFENAKSILKSILKAKPGNGTASFILGNVYLKQTYIDSAKIAFQKGLEGSEGAKLNYIGLGQIDLENNNATAAQANFALATKDAKKKGIEEFTYIGRAFMNISKPDYKSAVEVLNRANAINNQDPQVLLALGDAYYGIEKQNDSFSAYRNAYDADKTMLRAKMQLGVLLKGAKAYDNAIASFNEVIAINPNYGPVYRELAETYYKWGKNVGSKYEESMKKAMTNYDKYMSLTDYSLASRMRRADFLILVKDYKALEIEANKMKELDKVNPRIFRYLGYSAYENGNVDVAISSLEKFIANPENKTIARDFYYLGFSKIKKGTSTDGLTIDPVAFSAGLVDVKKAVEMEPLYVDEFNEKGKKLFGQRLYKEAAAMFEFGASNSKAKNYLDDSLYYGLSLYYDNTKKDAKVDPVAMQKADMAFGNVNTASPNYQEAYLYRARTNALVENNEMMIKYYDQYIAKTLEKGPEEMAKPTTKKQLIESYNNLASGYYLKDKVKAKESVAKALALDPADKRALELSNSLK